MTDSSISSHDLIKADFDRDGFAAARNFLTAKQVQRLTDDVQRYIRDVLPGLSSDASCYENVDDSDTLYRLGKMSAHDPTFGMWLCEGYLDALASTLLDDRVVFHDSQLFGKSPRIGKQTPAHQDGFYFALEPNEALTIWLPLDSTDQTNGCIRYVPGSHRFGIQPHTRGNVPGFSQGLVDFTDEHKQAEVAVKADPGDLIVHHSVTIHRADANHSPRRRWAMGFVYFAQRAKRDEAAFEAYMRDLNAQRRTATHT